MQGAELSVTREELVELLLEDVDDVHLADGDLRQQTTILVDEILGGTVQVSDDLDATISARIADIDALVSAQVNEILHAAEFQQLEATWRGLYYLVTSIDEGAPIRVRVLDVSKKSLMRDLRRSPEFDQSALFIKVYEEEYGILGGEPFGLLVGDYYFDSTAPDVTLLERLSNVAAAAHAPILTGVSPAFFGWETMSSIQAARSLTKVIEMPEFAKWRAFRQSEDARYLGLVLPRVLYREAYRGQGSGAESFSFEEDVSAGADACLFGNPSFALAARVCASFADYRWCASIRGAEGGGLVEGLCAPDFDTDSSGIALRGPAETGLGDAREKELADLGFIPFMQIKGSGEGAFYSTQSCQLPKTYETEAATANARLMAQLQYTLSASRFAHYLKVMMRDKIGSFSEASECEDYLNRWITDYCLGNPEGAGPEARARKPLREARVEVRQSLRKPGSYEAVLFVMPHFQLEELTASLRLVTRLPGALGS